MRLTVAALFVTVSLMGSVTSFDYTGYSVYKVTPTNVGQVEFLKTMERQNWFEIMTDIRLGYPVHLMVAPIKRRVMTMLPLRGLRPTVFIQNVQTGIDAEKNRLAERYRTDAYSFNLFDFNTYDAVMKQMDVWKAACPFGLTCEIETIGKSVEDRDLKILTVKKTGVTDNPVFWMDAAIHPREWLSLATLQNIIDRIIYYYTLDDEVKKLVDNHDLYLFPVVNPDGYVHTWDVDRLWRKNLGTNPSSSCKGTDLNRNFDVEGWGEEGVSKYPCDATYCGSRGGSENETFHLQEKVDQLISEKKTIKAFISFHCFGKMWVFPPGGTVDHAGSVCDKSPNYDELMRVTLAGVGAVEATHGTKWIKGGICDILYPVTGSSLEYATEKGVLHTYTLELRGIWFVVDKSEIQPSYEETWNGMVAMIDAIDNA